MARIPRRNRVRCRLRCQIIAGPRPTEASIVSLSEGGLGVVAPLSLEQGDPIRLRILPPDRTQALEVSGIVWNDQPARVTRPRANLRLLGCLVSDPSEAFIALIKRLDRGSATGSARHVPTNRPRPADAPPAERDPAHRAARPIPVAKPRPAPTSTEETSDLPRLREPVPPPKPEPEETLPIFKVRMKQIGGPRTRIAALRAHSVAEAEELARTQLETHDNGSPVWELLEVVLAS